MTNPYPPLPSTSGRTGRSKMPPDGRVINFEIIDEVREFQDRARSKIVLLQLLRLDSGKKEVRVGYYIIGKLPRMKDRWVWGQYAAIIPLPAFGRLMRKAIAKGWFAVATAQPALRQKPRPNGAQRGPH